MLMLGAALLLSSCYSTGEGAFVGGQFGYVIGSAIGGITGGPRGHDLGALIGTVGGVAAGAAIGAASENAREQQASETAAARRSNRDSGYDSGYSNRESSRYDDSGYDPRGRGDDRVSLGLAGPGERLEIRNAAIEESVRDGVLTRGEECTVRFEIFNTSASPVHNVRPLVGDVTGNKHVKISPNLLIESIGPRQGVRYTATIVADRKLNDGEIKVMVGVAQGTMGELTSQTRYFTVPTAKSAR